MKRIFSVAVILFAIVRFGAAQIVDSSANGFTYKTTLTIQAPPQTVYERFLDVGNWWSSDHTYSRDAKNLSIDAKPMGCWCEKLPNGGGAKHMEVLTVLPGKLLVLSGGLGPLQSLAATATMRLLFAAAEGGTKLEVTYAVAGYVPAGMNTWAAPVTGVLNEQLSRFKSYTETGSPVPKK